MIRVALLFLALLVSVAYLAFPHSGAVGFLFSDEILSKKQWAYFFNEHFGMLILSIVILLQETKYKIAVWTFFTIQLVDIVDYSLTYSEAWTDSWVTFNTIKIIIFFVAFILSFIQYLHDRRRI